MTTKYKTYLHSRKLGKGGAIKSGLNLVSGDYVIIQDADLEYDPQDHLSFATSKN